jgi:hypothetical protein
MQKQCYAVLSTMIKSTEIQQALTLVHLQLQPYDLPVLKI